VTLTIDEAVNGMMEWSRLAMITDMPPWHYIRRAVVLANMEEQPDKQTTSKTTTYISPTIIYHLRHDSLFNMRTSFVIAFMAIARGLASTVPSQMGVEVIRENGEVIVREVVSGCNMASRDGDCD
jgi:hypothetical protein